MNNITIQEWDENRFFNSKTEWTDLLMRSYSDALFMSWEWQFTWWDVFSDSENMRLKLIVAIDNNKKLVGIAPLYTTEAITKKIVKTRRLQFIGGYWRGKDTMRTEFVDFIVDKAFSKDIVRSFFEYINSSTEWDEFILPDLMKETDTYQILMSEKPLKDCYYRISEEYDSYFLKTTGDFDGYIKGLGKNTRLKLFNRRKLLNQFGDIKFEKEISNEIDDNFELLNTLHRRRWGYTAFENERLKFNKTVAKLMAQKNALSFSKLSVNNKILSIQYNYIVNNHKYNIQAGFDETFHKKLALGFLHFGYEIEHAYNKGISTYDFLAGEGKNTQYKSQLTKTSLEIVQLQIIRNKVVKYLYKLYDLI